MELIELFTKLSNAAPGPVLAWAVYELRKLRQSVDDLNKHQAITNDRTQTLLKTSKEHGERIAILESQKTA